MQQQEFIETLHPILNRAIITLQEVDKEGYIGANCPGTSGIVLKSEALYLHFILNVPQILPE